MFEFNQFELHIKAVSSSVALKRRTRVSAMSEPAFLKMLRFEGCIVDPVPSAIREIDKKYSPAHGIKCDLRIGVLFHEEKIGGLVDYLPEEIIGSRTYPKAYEITVYVTQHEFYSVTSSLGAVNIKDLRATVWCSSDQECPSTTDIAYRFTGPSIASLADMEKPHCTIDVFEFFACAQK